MMRKLLKENQALIVLFSSTELKVKSFQIAHESIWRFESIRSNKCSLRFRIEMWIASVGLMS